MFSRKVFLHSLFAVVLVLAGCSDSDHKRNGLGRFEIKNDKPGPGVIVAFGDSLTSGIDQQIPYSDFMGQTLGVTVYNTAKEGRNSKEAVAEFQKMVLDFHPKLVVMTIGGNDALKEPRVPKSESLANLEKMIKAAQADGGLVVFGGILPPVRKLFPEAAYVSDQQLEQAYGLSRFAEMNDLARTLGAIVIDDFMDGLWLDSRYKQDRLHPNTDGNKIIAKRFLKAIEGHYP